MKTLPSTDNSEVNKLYRKFNLLCDYQTDQGYDLILEMALNGLKDEYGFKVELAKNMARQKGADYKEIVEKFKLYDDLSKHIDNALFNYIDFSD